MFRGQLDLRMYFFSERIVDRWNSLDVEVSACSLNSFKNNWQSWDRIPPSPPIDQYQPNLLFLKPEYWEYWAFQWYQECLNWLKQFVATPATVHQHYVRTDGHNMLIYFAASSQFIGGSHWTACHRIQTSLKPSSLALALDSEVRVPSKWLISAMFLINRRKVFTVLVIDNTLPFDAQVNSVCKAANYNAEALRHIRN